MVLEVLEIIGVIFQSEVWDPWILPDVNQYVIFYPKTKVLLKEISRLHDFFLTPGGIIKDPSLCEVRMKLRLTLYNNIVGAQKNSIRSTNKEASASHAPRLTRDLALIVESWQTTSSNSKDITQKKKGRQCSSFYHGNNHSTGSQY
jgi:hypothetical protein